MNNDLGSKEANYRELQQSRVSRCGARRPAKSCLCKSGKDKIHLSDSNRWHVYSALWDVLDDLAARYIILALTQVEWTFMRQSNTKTSCTSWENTVGLKETISYQQLLLRYSPCQPPEPRIREDLVR